MRKKRRAELVLETRVGRKEQGAVRPGAVCSEGAVTSITEAHGSTYPLVVPRNTGEGSEYPLVIWLFYLVK